MYKDTHTRSILKSFSWRISATLTTIALVWTFTGQIATALAVAGLEFFVKMAVYFLHERAWDKIKFGRREVEPSVFWFTGYSGSGKRLLADAACKYLKSKGLKVERLDGEKVRSLFPEIGFSKSQRLLHIKRVGHLASILEKNGIFVVASFVSPDQESRDFVRRICSNFIEIHVSTPIEKCKEFDSEHLLEKAMRGELNNFAGINSPYEVPQDPDLRLDIGEIGIALAPKRIEKFVEAYI